MLAVASAQNPFSLSTSGKDADAHKLLKLERIEFEEGTQSAVLAVPEGRYQPINDMPEASTSKLPAASDNDHTPSAASTSTHNADASTGTTAVRAQYPSNFPREFPKVGCGLYNNGNTCFLNSALQCLLHTPPLLHASISHSTICAHQQAESFCMVCAYRKVALESFQHRGTAFVPHAISANLYRIAKHLRKGRQEDAHEFLRFCIDAMQKTCMHGKSKKPDSKDVERTWINQIFGGKLRSRVTCQSCGHNSDTFDSILDLSLDIYNCSSIGQALKRFVAVDHLRGADKYKCEKCKKAVNADKQFTIHAAPQVLTVHLKRFTPFGKKLAAPVDYGSAFSLKGAMSNSEAPQYKLYGVICHAGGGPNSGHYYAYVKGPNGTWYEMNDDSVSLHKSAPINLRNAYILFYLRDESSTLDDLVHGRASAVDRTPLGGKSKAVDRTPLAVVKLDIANERRNSVGTPSVAPTTSRPVFSASVSLAPEKVDFGGDRSAALAAFGSRMKRRERGPLVRAPLPGLSGYGSDDDDTGEKVRRATATPSSPPTAKEPVSLPPSSPPAGSSSPEKHDSDEAPEEVFTRRPVATKRTAEMLGLQESPPKRSRRSSSPPQEGENERSFGSAKRRPSMGNPFGGRQYGGNLHVKRNNGGAGLLDVRPSGKFQRRKPGL